MTTRVALAMVALIIAASAWGTSKAEINALAVAQHEGTTAPQTQQGMPDMMKMHEQMMAEMKANRARLDILTKEMNEASGSQKVDAIAAVVNELVRQENAMYERMGQMHGLMMSGRGIVGGRNMMGR